MQQTIVIESPCRGTTPMEYEAHRAYARLCLLDSLGRGESPFASHILYTQVLDDREPLQRSHGIDAGLALGGKLDATAVYLDHGVSAGMRYGIAAAIDCGRPVYLRTLWARDDRWASVGAVTREHAQAFGFLP